MFKRVDLDSQTDPHQHHNPNRHDPLQETGPILTQPLLDERAYPQLCRCKIDSRSGIKYPRINQIMQSFEAELLKLGLSEKEVAVYLTLLSNGPSSVRKLAGISTINRGTTYDCLRELKERGLVSHFNEESKQCFVAEDPARLQELVFSKQAELDRSKGTLEELIPELRALHDRGAHRPVSRYYEGSQGVRTILLDVLETMEKAEDKTYFVYSSASVRESGLYDNFKNYTDERIAKGLSVKTISLGPGGTATDLSERKWLNAPEGTPTYILLYDGKCAYISLGPSHSLFGVVIENPGVYQTQKLIFQQLWNTL